MAVKAGDQLLVSIIHFCIFEVFVVSVSTTNQKHFIIVKKISDSASTVIYML